MAQNLEAIYLTIAWRLGSWHGMDAKAGSVSQGLDRENRYLQQDTTP